MEKKKPKQKPPNDIAIRLPENQKHFKVELNKLAKRNGMSLTALMLHVIEWFLEEHRSKPFSIRLK